MTEPGVVVVAGGRVRTAVVAGVGRTERGQEGRRCRWQGVVGEI